jgi:hypothetical protein
LFKVQSKKRKKFKNSPLNLYKSSLKLLIFAFNMFNSLKYPLIESRFNLYTYKSLINDRLIKSNSKVLLAYASLYVLAEKWGVNSLKMLILSKLY